MCGDELRIFFHDQFALKKTSLNENISVDGWQLDNNWEFERTVNKLNDLEKNLKTFSLSSAVDVAAAAYC